MGWSPFSFIPCHELKEEKVLAAAQVLNDSLINWGYQYVNLDNCWQGDRSPTNGSIVPNFTRFPDGISGLADKIHIMNLKLGLYSIGGDKGCSGGHGPGSLCYEKQDAADFASWGIDFLKYDNCAVPTAWQDDKVWCVQDRKLKLGKNGTCNTKEVPDLAPPDYDWLKSNSSKRYNIMGNYLKAESIKANRPILFNLCIWGTAGVYEWGNQTGISWRISQDSQPDWKRLMSILNIASFKMHAVGFWGRNDADTLQLGNGVSFQEGRSQFALWAAMKSPLIISSNLTSMTSDNLAVLTNKYLVQFNQDDKHPRPAMPYKWGFNKDWTFDAEHPAEFWSGWSTKLNGTLVLMLNTLEINTTKTAVFSEIPQLKCKGNCNYTVTNVWDDTTQCVSNSYSADVQSHDTAVIFIGAPCQIVEARILSVETDL